MHQSRTRKRSKCQWSERRLGTDTALVFWTRATVSSYRMQRKSVVCASACEASGDWGGFRADCRSGRMCAALLLRILWHLLSETRREEIERDFCDWHQDRQSPPHPPPPKPKTFWGRGAGGRHPFPRAFKPPQTSWRKLARAYTTVHRNISAIRESRISGMRFCV